MDRHLILASASPRRAELLASAGFTFRVRPAEVDETPHSGEAPGPVRDARGPREGVRGRGDARKTRDIVLAADTTVVVGGEMFGKPRDRPDAARMLHSLSDTVHEVLTGVVVRAGDREDQQVVRTRVHFLPLSRRNRRGTSGAGRAGRQGGRLCHPGPGGAFHRLD